MWALQARGFVSFGPRSYRSATSAATANDGRAQGRRKLLSGIARASAAAGATHRAAQSDMIGVLPCDLG